LPQPPTALYAIHDFVAIDALHAAHDRGLRVPHDIAIASFDGLPVTRFTTPPLTAVHQPVAQVGRVAVEALLARIADPSQPPIRHTIPVELIARESTLGTAAPTEAP
jgi:LacI family transcriptional regulator